MFIVIIDEPHDIEVWLKVDTTVVECCDTGKFNRGTVGLYYTAVKISLKVIDEVTDRNLLVGVVAGQIDADKTNKLDLGMLAEGLLEVGDIMCLGWEKI